MGIQVEKGSEAANLVAQMQREHPDELELKETTDGKIEISAKRPSAMVFEKFVQHELNRMETKRQALAAEAAKAVADVAETPIPTAA